MQYRQDKWVSVTTAWHVLGVRIEERSPGWKEVVFQLWSWIGCEKLLTEKTYHVTKYNLVPHT